jgi:CBS domain-containing protein
MELMWKFDVGCLPVVDDARRVTGIVTDRDLAIAGFLQAAHLRSITISTVMTKDVFCCPETASLSEVERLMSVHQVRRIPITGKDGVLQGMVTLNDLARAAAEGKFPPAQIASALAAISHPRRVLPPACDDD